MAKGLAVGASRWRWAWGESLFIVAAAIALPRRAANLWELHSPHRP